MFNWFKKKEVIDNRQKILFIVDSRTPEILKTLYLEGSQPFLFQVCGILPCIGASVIIDGYTWKVHDIWMYLDCIPGPDNIVMKIYIRKLI